MNEETQNYSLDYIEHQANFFERNLNGRNRQTNVMSTTMIIASLVVLLIKAIVMNARELKRMNDRAEK